MSRRDTNNLIERLLIWPEKSCFGAILTLVVFGLIGYLFNQIATLPDSFFVVLCIVIFIIVLIVKWNIDDGRGGDNGNRESE